jgi:putative transposase
VSYLTGQHHLSVTKACKALKLSRSSYYRPLWDKPSYDEPVVTALNRAVVKNGRWGFWKCFSWMQSQGYQWNHKRVYRVYCELRLNLPRRTKKRLPKREAKPLTVPSVPNHMWSLDFMHDTMANGRRFRTLNVLDEGVRECLSIEVDTSLPAARVIRVLEQLKSWRGLPQQLRLDNGPEFIAESLVSWCRSHDIHLAYIQPGKPNQNAYIERFNRTFRYEVLDAHIFENLEQVRDIAWEWIQQYNEERPHDALGRIPPSVFRRRITAGNSTLELSP